MHVGELVRARDEGGLVVAVEDVRVCGSASRERAEGEGAGYGVLNTWVRAEGGVCVDGRAIDTYRDGKT